jgi:hypothetical protein
MRADLSQHPWKGDLLADYGCRLGEPPLTHKANITGNVYPRRASVGAGSSASLISRQLTNFIRQCGSGANLDTSTTESAPILVKRRGRIGAYRQPPVLKNEANSPNPSDLFTCSYAQGTEDTPIVVQFKERFTLVDGKVSIYIRR